MEVSKPVSVVIIVIVLAVICAIGYTMFFKAPSGNTSEKTADMYRKMGKLGPQTYTPGGGSTGSPTNGGAQTPPAGK